VPAPRRYVTEAIVLSRFDYGEADRILTLITPSGGKIKAIAKGIRRQKSRIGGSLEPFAELRLALAHGRWSHWTSPTRCRAQRIRLLARAR
jgi:DNA repair protein RecO (recombination protein O)